ncbi:MAG TPA: LURP-one-related family protein [Verrucomicrobiae bacterium]|nr:LURP-one-related family protein [Verrucomicrobiae bacterium]
MRYIMRQKIFALGDDFVIKDETGADRFKVDGKIFTIGNKLSLQDMNGRELAFIQQKLLSFKRKYEIHRDGGLAAVVSKELFTLFHCKFVVDVPGPNDLEAKGNFLDHEYEFTRGGRVVGACSKQWFSWSDTYGIEVAPGEDDVLILASSVVIDMICHDDDK